MSPTMTSRQAAHRIPLRGVPSEGGVPREAEAEERVMAAFGRAFSPMLASAASVRCVGHDEHS